MISMVFHFKNILLTTFLTLAPLCAFPQSRDSGGGEPSKIEIERVQSLLSSDQSLLKVAMINYLKSISVEKVTDPTVRELFTTYPGIAAFINDIKSSKYEQKKQCYNSKGENVAASAVFGDVGGPICFDVKKLALEYRSLDEVKTMINFAALVFHEHLHHFQTSPNSNPDLLEILEKQAYKLAAYITLSAKSASLPVLSWVDTNKPKRKYSTKQYSTNLDNECLDGFIEGDYATSQGTDIKDCLNIDFLGDSYATAIKNKCIEGYVEEAPYTSQNWDGKKCVKLSVIQNQKKYNTHESNNCIPGFIEGTSYEAQGWNCKECLRLD